MGISETEIRAHAAHCGLCGGAVQLAGRYMIGEVVDCPRCSATLEVENLEPLLLVPFARVEEQPEDLLRGLQGFELL